MANSISSDVVIVGGGLAGIATAYYLGRAGVRSTVVERDGVGSHASGFAYGGLGSLNGAGIPGPTHAIAIEGIRLHKELAACLPEETGVNFEFREIPSLSLVFTEEEAQDVQALLPWQQKQPGAAIRWVDAAEVKKIEPRTSDEVLGGLYVEGWIDLEPYRLILALTQAAEKLGATIRHGRVVGLRREGDRVGAVVLKDDEIPCSQVVLAMGPWTDQASAWLDVPLRVWPLKGQILRLRVPGPPFRLSIGWQGNYATTKTDGLLWTGTTEEDVGYNEATTSEARDQIIASLRKMVQGVEDAQLVLQTACLRPMTVDWLMSLGGVPGWEGVFVATGGGRQGITLGPAMGHIVADLVVKGITSFSIDAFNPSRFVD